MISFGNFLQSIQEQKLPGNISIYLQALWYDAQGDWKKAHSLVDDSEDPVGCWVHAYLHRKEPDTWNADYWYRRAGKSRPAYSLEEEWETIVKAIL